MTSMSKPQGRCIFCGDVGVTKEHLFSDWLRELFPRAEADTHTIGRRDYVHQSEFELDVRQGHAGTRHVRKVCRACNGGWISGIDNAAKKAIVPLIRREPILVDQGIQRVIATWFAKISMVGDMLNPEKSVVTEGDRRRFKEHRLPPEAWEVWIANYSGVAWSQLGIQQHAGQLTLPAVRNGVQLSGYTMATSLGLGTVFGLVLGTEIDQLGFTLGRASSYMTRIWPTGRDFSWPLEHQLSDTEATAIANVLTTMVVNPIGATRAA